MPLFLFSDIENSTRLWEKYPEGMKIALKLHDGILEKRLSVSGGRIIKHTGDGVFAVFEEPSEGQACALAVQKDMAACDWGEVGEVRIRMALHYGDAVLRGDDYFGPAVNRAARLMSAGWGGQILLSREALEHSEVPAGAEARDLGMHLLKDLREPIQIHQLDHPDLPRRSFPEPRTLSARPNNLPPESTPFVGRVEELREIHELLEGENRLLTLLGPGGMGKTRLALQVGRESIEKYYHGVYFVSMAPLENADRLVYALADALRFTFYNNDDPRLQLENYLREKEMLIVLDNFEHIIEGAELAGALLDAAPSVRIVATSREKLRLRHERVFAVGGMRFPSNAPDLEEDGYSAVSLFAQAALRVRPDFDVQGEREHVHRICELVGGMPLAIELAGAWCESLECADIVKELERDGDFLETDLRDVPERHRSLRAVFDYSWNLLNEKERGALARLTVFRGDFTREAAAGALDVSLSVLTGLLNKSLVHKTERGRFAVHNMLARYADEMLTADERREGLARHSAWFGEFARERRAAMWRLPSDLEVQREVMADLENLRAGFLEAARGGRWEEVGAYMRTMNGAFEGGDRQREGERVIGRVLEELEKHPSDGESRKLTLIFLRCMRAWLGLRFGGLDEKRRVLEQADEMLGEAEVEERVLLDGIRSFIEYITGNYEAAARWGENARDLAFKLELPWSQSFTQAHLAYVYFIRGETEKAKTSALNALALTRRLNLAVGSAYNLNNLAEMEKAEGNLERAETYLEEALLKFEEAGLKSGVGFVLNNLAELDIQLGRQTLAWERYERALEMAQDLGFDWGMGTALQGLGVLALALEDYDEADRRFQESLVYFERLGDSYRIARGHRKLGETALARQEQSGALKSFRRALEIALEAGIPAEILSGMVRIIELELLRIDPARGLQLLAPVLAHENLGGDTRTAAEALRGRLEQALGEGAETRGVSGGESASDLRTAARALLDEE